jgi:hypothetical protein
MAKFTDKLARQWPDIVNLVLGVWLVLSPWALGFVAETRPTWNAWILGVIIAVAAIAALFAFQEWEEWVNAVLGLWLIVSPWVLGYSAMVAAAMWNQVVVGLIVAALAAWAIWDARHRVAPAR